MLGKVIFSKKRKMQSIKSTGYEVYFGDEGFVALEKFLAVHQPSKLFALVDENTERDCLPIVLKKIGDNDINILRIPSGEIHKNLNTCTQLWQQLTDLGADRKSLLINMGGGVITDMGGFVASAYKRGIAFINISTTLLGMVDASVGSKTGVDLGGLKNQIGFFADPAMVIVDPIFLKTLPKIELIAAYAEIIKYGLSYDATLWDDFSSDGLKNADDIIHRCIKIKNEVVLTDKKENNLRKVLNFGHTVGHAVESHFLLSEHKENLTHGAAIAVGMVVACFLSYELLGFPLDKCDDIKRYIKSIFGVVPLARADHSEIISLLQHDKKNTSGDLNFVLIKAIGSHKIDCKVTVKQITKALDYYEL